MRFFCKHFHQREKHYHRCKICFASVPCMKKEMSVLRPEDNVDNDMIVLNKHLVLKKNISTGKGRLDGWAYRTEQQCIDGFSDIDECKGNHSCHVNAPKDLMFVLVTPDILEMEATAQVLDVFLLKPFPSERKALFICETCFTSVPCIDPFTPTISSVVLLTVCHTILMILVLRIWY